MTYVAAAAILTMAFVNGSIGCFESATAQLPSCGATQSCRWLWVRRFCSSVDFGWRSDSPRRL